MFLERNWGNGDGVECFRYIRYYIGSRFVDVIIIIERLFFLEKGVLGVRWI